uniref:ATP-binding cassette sub-family G member 2-like n=1 Tax=Sinocyclocheilus grahami TaxID=75366 RepID=A0A672L1E6_SINGR
CISLDNTFFSGTLKLHLTEVSTDDIVMGTLTVRENLCFSAALRLPKSICQLEKDEKVERLIQELGLSKVAGSWVGTQLIRGVSGGERKRTSIGMELIFDPPVLFVDEPTTGLDASTANSVLMLMANSGRTIILSIHQPRYSIYRLFDSLTLLVGGRMVYHGLAQDALDYFSQIGMKTYTHMNRPSRPDTDVCVCVCVYQDTPVNLITILLISSWMSSMENPPYKQTKSELERIVQGQDYSTRPKSRTITYSTSFCHQFNWVLRRTFKNLMLNPQTSFAQVSTTVYIRHSQMFLSVFEEQTHRDVACCALLGRVAGLYTRRSSHYYMLIFPSAIIEYIHTHVTTFDHVLIISHCSCSTGEDFLSDQGIDYSTWGLWQNHLALGIMTLIFLIIAYLKLRFIKKFT